ncbi:hypothetical protein HBH56_130400 [Parastagonospora nodorum]|uniref:Uncharacterized protein n=2 Tax=Phaeosphaeria nodorum (strain SN15 / ATCC MYA-4574 / FGSC 10173) TaxID=321614 RepID=Q0UR02_PHANO|nr:hypothetical protein SNOG_05812 [Parastagonospora nodorum SN15]KAH3911920.1 hypothetical protein HBH56_130400 [Parastagonospora nodorum]EAT86876.2 hypothetical protein SNOG_05812 [Parastagonospora nodorum SN15]KAH3931196.1 hypothetical protein HBH54_093100 [Parastagonospora nodorum]KAH3947404.1 hypothetical protein HBH53_120760 [Parastagonospora nodorum]KAH3970738.1 hypothetical protein HBH51_117080 [Parastagonospora nodorum]
MDPIAEGWKKLRLLFIEEQEQQAMDNVQSILTQPSDMHQLLERAMIDANEEQTMTSLDSIRSSLGMNRDIDDIETEIGVAIEEYNVHFCRAIAVKLLAKLPRELRDMVYSHLLPGDINLCRIFSDTFHVTLDHPLYDEGPGEEDTERLYFPECARSAAGDTLCPEYFWRDDVVGVQMAHELMETFYQTTKFSFENVYGCKPIDGTFLPDLLQTDRFAAGFEPRQLISNYSQELCIQNEALGLHQIDTLTLNTCLENLWLLKGNARILLKVSFNNATFSHQKSQATTVDEIIKTAFPEIVRLRTAGYRLSVELEDGGCHQETKAVFSHWMNKLELEVRTTPTNPAGSVE